MPAESQSPKELVERLRQGVFAIATEPGGERVIYDIAGANQAMRKAADLIERLTAPLEGDVVERYRTALEQIKQWSDAYPADIFQEPDLDAVKAVLAEHGMTVQMDRMHASWARRLVDGVGDIARNALSGLG